MAFPERDSGPRRGSHLFARWFLVLGLCLACTGFGPPVLTGGSADALRLGADDVARLVALSQFPSITAESALVVDLDSGETLFSQRAGDPLPPASTAKIMTALVVLEHAALDEIVTVSAKAAATGGSRMGLVTGESLTVEELLKGLLLPSGNDAAQALAEHVAGDDASFVVLMNQLSSDLGLSATHFANPHGLDADGQVTSAADLVVMVRAGFEVKAFADIVAMQTANVAGRALVNTNDLLGSYPGADGIKTGTTDAAGECLVASVRRDDHRVLAIILGSRDRYADARSLLDYAATGWRWGSVGLPDDALAWAIGTDGRFYRLRSLGTSDIFLPSWQWPLVHAIRRLDVNVPLTGTLPVGEVQWRIGDGVIAVVPLVAAIGP